MSVGRYRVAGLNEAESEPGSRGRVLANLRGIRGVREMQVAESIELLRLTGALLREVSAVQTISADDLCEWHRRWLGGLYAWAGDYRNVNLSKGGFPFAAAAQVPRLMQRFEREVLAVRTPMTPADDSSLAHGLAIAHAELILIHPFRDGNGRLVRLLCTVMAAQAGLPPLNFSPMAGRGRRAYIGAIHASVGGDYKPLASRFRRVIARSLSDAGS